MISRLRGDLTCANGPTCAACRRWAVSVDRVRIVTRILVRSLAPSRVWDTQHRVADPADDLSAQYGASQNKQGALGLKIGGSANKVRSPCARAWLGDQRSGRRFCVECHAHRPVQQFADPIRNTLRDESQSATSPACNFDAIQCTRNRDVNDPWPRRGTAHTRPAVVVHVSVPLHSPTEPLEGGGIDRRPILAQPTAQVVSSLRLAALHAQSTLQKRGGAPERRGC